MARPKKDNADYFSHDNNMRNDPKVKALRRKFKEGYATWNMILEVLTEADGFSIELTEINIEILAGDFDIEPTTLKDIIDYCIVLNLLQKDGEKLFSEAHLKRMQPVIEKRIKGGLRSRNPDDVEFLSQKPHIKGVSATESTQSKAKQRKGTASSENLDVFEIMRRQLLPAQFSDNYVRDQAVKFVERYKNEHVKNPASLIAAWIVKMKPDIQKKTFVN